MPIATFPNDHILIGQNNTRSIFFVQEDIVINWNGYCITIEAGFKTDLASTPWIFRKSGKWNRAAIAHDYLYRGQGAVNVADGTSGRLTREDADMLFLDAMAALNVGKITRWTMYASVRHFGGSSWQETKS